MTEIIPFGGTGSTMEYSGMFFAIDTDTDRNTEAMRAKSDSAFLEDFIRRNRRFILGCAYKTAHRFITESDDEYSIALIAFHEAVMTYDAGKGSFKSFAGLVIKRRLLDWFDSQGKYRREVSVDLGGTETSEDDMLQPVQMEARNAVARQSMEADSSEAAMRDEIEGVSDVLRAYDISFFDLADCSPKAQKTKDACGKVLRALLADGELLERLRRTKTLPSAALCRAAGVPKKILENHRKYIIAAAEILDGDYPGLAEYLCFVRKGSDGS